MTKQSSNPLKMIAFLALVSIGGLETGCDSAETTTASDTNCVVMAFGARGELTRKDLDTVRGSFQPPMSAAMAQRLLRERALLALDAGEPLSAALDENHSSRKDEFLKRFDASTPRETLKQANEAIDAMGASHGFETGPCWIEPLKQ